MTNHNELDPRAVLAVVLPLLAQGTEGWDDIFVGSLPNNWPSSLEPPQNVVVQGGLTRGKTITAVFEYPKSSESPVFEYRDHIERNGWTPRHPFGSEGFDSGRIAVYEQGELMAGVGSRPGTSGQQTVIVSVYPSVRNRTSDEMRTMMKEQMRFPRLVPPPGMIADGAGSCGGGDHTTHTVQLKTDRAPGDLLNFFAAQLATRNWRLGATDVSETTATQWLEVDFNQAVWRGLLGVYANGSVRDVFVHIARAAG